MANYLPVLLVSVAANSIPDDSSVATLPRAQVDYLSHNWEEEDVWRSWRNMTRQKNEIANGVRLENASWRTWWKQRNGLGTVTPETLNWLKDSDVTWLYGPLHTAGDWAPPPKPLPSPGLDLTTHKPILKHRSISQLLTSDLPSPVFSPTGPDSEASYFVLPPPHVADKPDGSSKPRRPVLPHTKSDTHITRWGPNRAFRKDSPPRIDPPAQPPSPTGIHSPEGYYSSTNQSSDSITPAPSQRIGQKKRHISFNTFVEQCIAIDKPKKKSGYTEDDEAGDNDDDNDDGVDEDDHLLHGVVGRYAYGRNSWAYDDGYEQDADEDESDEDAEAASFSMWDERFRSNRTSGSDSDSNEDGVGDEEGQVDEDEGDGVIDMRSYTRTKANSPRSESTASTASSSSSASTSTSVSSSTPPTSESPDRLNPEKRPSRRRHSTSSTSTYRPRFHPSSGSRKHRNAPPLIRTSTSERRSATSPPPQANHVTIAPIAPTILKTGTHGYYEHHQGGWSEGFGDEGASDDGIWGGGSRWWEKGKGKANEESESSGGQTPVELVYVPPLGSNYSFRGKSEQRISLNERERDREEKKGVKFVNEDVMEDHEDGFGNGDHDVYRRRATLFCVGDGGADFDVDDADGTVMSSRGVHRSATVPTVVVGPDETHSYERADVGEDFRSRRSSSSSLSYGRNASISIDIYRGRVARPTSPATREEVMNQRERSRSKSRSRSHSRSHSRTPSPAMITDLCGDVPQVPVSSVSDSGPGHTHGPVLILRRSSSSSIFPASASSLLSPPPRSRGSQSYQDVGSAQQQRGRSNTRTGSSISRERSTGSNSLGSLSPEAWDSAGVAAAYTGGRHELDRDKDRRDKERERPSGRECVDGQRLGPGQGHNVSPEGVQDSFLRSSPASTAPSLPPPATESETPRGVVTSKAKVSVSSASSSPSSSSNSSTAIVPSHSAIVTESEATSLPIPVAVPIDVRTAEEHRRNIQPTPSNSPVIHMRSVLSVAAACDSTPASRQESDWSSSQSHPTPTATYSTRIKSPLVVPAVSPAEPSTSYSISPPCSELSPPSSPLNPTRSEITIVGKAVEMVSSAGAFFGLWNYST